MYVCKHNIWIRFWSCMQLHKVVLYTLAMYSYGQLTDLVSFDETRGVLSYLFCNTITEVHSVALWPTVKKKKKYLIFLILIFFTISKLSHLSNVQPMVDSIMYYSSCRISFSICLIPKRNLWRNRVLHWKHLKTHTKVNFNIWNFSCKLKTSKLKQQQSPTSMESHTINK